MCVVITGDHIEQILRNMDVVAESSLNGCTVDTRRISDMREYYMHPTENGSEKIVYQILAWPDQGRMTDLLVTVTVLHPGRVGEEHFHTKGHFHNDPDGPEFVVGYKGTGILQTGDRTGRVKEVHVGRGTHVLIPEGTAHRVINRSDEPVVYLSISSAAVGHDYESVALLHWK